MVVLPVRRKDAHISSGFGQRDGVLHAGIDYAVPIGTPIYAAADGFVVEGIDRYNVDGFGSWIWIDCQASAGVDLIYGHVKHSGILVKAGDLVRAGQLIGVSGNEGQTTGPHLHFEVWTPPGRVGGSPRDPAPWLANATDPEHLPDTPPAPRPLDYGITHRIAAGTDGPRGRTDFVAEHTQEGGSGDAVGLANYCVNAGVSYNLAVDDVHTVEMVAPGNAPWAAVAANSVGWHCCFAGSYAAWGRNRWLSSDASDGLDENAMLWRGARATAAACRQFNIPLKHVGADAYSSGNWPGERGICGHVAFGARGGGHHDPGLGFPWDVFIDRVKSFLAPAVNLIDAEARIAAAWIGKRLSEDGVNGEKRIVVGGKEIGRFVPYENGHIYWQTGAGQAIAIPHGGIFEAYAARGWEQGELGFPVLRHDVVKGGGVQSFHGGVLMVQTGADPKGHVVHGEIGKRYATMGWEQGPLGWPTSDEQPVSGTDNITQTFEHGRLTWSPTGVIVQLSEA